MLQQNELRPFFSIIIPTWNRRYELERCLKSILEQDFSNFEVIIVDDASDDDSVDFLNLLCDTRVNKISHTVNRGVCASRNTGSEQATGKWFLFVDSDWELLPRTLSKLYAMTERATLEIGVIGGYTITDYGLVWPGSNFPEDPFAYIDYLKWLEDCVDTGSDWLPCYRREIFDQLNWPTDRRLEIQFHLRVARHYRLWVTSDVLSIEHTKSINRITNDNTNLAFQRKIAMAAAQAMMFEEILQEFGDDLQNYAPQRFWEFTNNASRYNLLAGEKRHGFKFIMNALKAKRCPLDLWAILFVVAICPKYLGTIADSRLAKKLYYKLKRMLHP